MATAPFLCMKCGATLSIPPNPMAMAARCVYCGTETMLPPQVLAARQQPQFSPVMMHPITAVTPVSGPDAAKRMRLVLWIVALSVLLPLFLTGGIMWFVHSVLSDVGVIPRHR